MKKFKTSIDNINVLIYNINKLRNKQNKLVYGGIKMYSNGEIKMVLHEIEMAENWDNIDTSIYIELCESLGLDYKKYTDPDCMMSDVLRKWAERERLTDKKFGSLSENEKNSIYDMVTNYVDARDGGEPYKNGVYELIFDLKIGLSVSGKLTITDDDIITEISDDAIIYDSLS